MIMTGIQGLCRKSNKWQNVCEGRGERSGGTCKGIRRGYTLLKNIWVIWVIPIRSAKLCASCDIWEGVVTTFWERFVPLYHWHTNHVQTSKASAYDLNPWTDRSVLFNVQTEKSTCEISHQWFAMRHQSTATPGRDGSSRCKTVRGSMWNNIGHPAEEHRSAILHNCCDYKYYQQSPNLKQDIVKRCVDIQSLTKMQLLRCVTINVLTD